MSAAPWRTPWSHEATASGKTATKTARNCSRSEPERRDQYEPERWRSRQTAKARSGSLHVVAIVYVRAAGQPSDASRASRVSHADEATGIDA